MAIHRGIQSAIFYYLSCAPCAEARYRKKRKQEAVRGRAERAALEAEMPDVYRHPSPSSTNPYWQSEIAAGPALVSRGKKKANANNRQSGRGLKSSATRRSNDTSSTSLTQRDGGSSRNGRVDSKWHFQQFQRDDEPYGSASTERLASNTTLDGSASGRSGISRPPKAKTRTGDDYFDVRNPEVNERHPAVVTRISSREEAQWLMAPPPTADFMSGKERSSRSRSDSGGSRLSSRSGVPLSREVSRRIIEQKIRNGEGPLTPPLSREATFPVASDPAGQRHDRTATDEKDFAVDRGPVRQPKQRPPPLRLGSSDESNGSAQTVVRNGNLSVQPAYVRKVASRPQLYTIVSDESAAAVGFDTPLGALYDESQDDDSSSVGRNRTSRRSPLLVQDDSLKVLQGVDPNLAVTKSHVVVSKDWASGTKPKQIRLPSQDASEEKRLEGGPELYDSWYTPDFQLPEWIHEHTKREVTKRWSMDI
ncbi:uncharacterized protein LTR77_006615 [Saxophila tyrrhenica]|uniref:Signal peptide-containing protein n=1 Tax=Saxophila tyrrhenica TaxID=1690608 RepID=A0AAV9P5D9_9PEZI|nr:hypothetical protein LTR77_006615 [Saxophila tyrrhenica]